MYVGRSASSDLMVFGLRLSRTRRRPTHARARGGRGRAFGSFLRMEGRGDTVCVGRDSRTSGPMFVRAAVAGLQSVGVRVVDVGVVPTPTLLLATRHHGASGGIGVTASHNPAEWNALKLVTGGGIFLDAELSRPFQKYLREQDPPRAGWKELGKLPRTPRRGLGTSKRSSACPSWTPVGCVGAHSTSPSTACTVRAAWSCPSCWSASGAG